MTAARDAKLRSTSGWQRQAETRRILTQHRGICHVCGKPGANEVDHVIPLAEGGTDTDDNKRPIHAKPCHREKSNAEAARGRARKSRQRQQPPHPGLTP